MPENQTLALVGGEISLEGATLKTAGGRIELGSVSGEGLVSLTPINKGFALGYAAGQSFGNIQLSNQATVDASGAGGGDVLLTGRRVSLRGGSQIEASTLGSQSGGTLALNASELVEVSGSGSSLFVAAYPSATGAAGNLTINTPVLQVQNGGQVNASTYGAGKGGNLTVNASKEVQLIGESADGVYSSSLVSESQGSGSSGELRINTGKLIATDGAYVSTYAYSSGNGGNLAVQASDSVEVVGIGRYLRSDLYTGTNPNTTGNAGNLTVTTGRLSVRDGASVNTSTGGAGNGGNLTVKFLAQLQARNLETLRSRVIVKLVLQVHSEAQVMRFVEH